MQEYPVIDSAPSVDQLRRRLKDGELEQYGDAFTPDFVYNVINRLPRFSSMRVSYSSRQQERMLICYSAATNKTPRSSLASSLKAFTMSAST